jgi:hypothetical protein
VITTRCIGTGLKRAIGQPGLAAILWAWTFLLAALVALPAWTAFAGAFNLSTESAQLLDGFNLRLLFEAFHYDRSSVLGILAVGLAAVLVVGGIGGTFLAGGVLEVLTAGDDRSFLHRFMRGAGHFFGRFFRLFLACAVSIAATALAVSLAALLVTRPLSRSDSEALRFFSYLVVPAAVLLVAAFYALALDYARIRMVLDGRRSATRAWFGSLGFVLRHLPGTVVIGLAFAVLTGLVLALSAGYQRRAPSNTFVLILGLFLVQQVTAYVRAGLRVASVAGELAFYEARRPPAMLAAPATGFASSPETPDASPAATGPEGPDAAGPQDKTREWVDGTAL